MAHSRTKLNLFCRHTLALFAGLAISSFSQADSLTEIYELAVKNDATILAAAATYRAGVEQEKIARSGLLPQVYGNGALQTSSLETDGAFPVGSTLFPNKTDTQADTTFWGASLQQPLFDMPAWFNFQQGKELSRQAASVFATEQQSLIIRVAEAYFNVLRNIDELQASRAQEEANKRQLDQTQQRFDVGLIAITDVHEAQASYDLAVANRLGGEGQLGVSLEVLTVFTGQPHGELWLLSEDFPIAEPTPLSKDEWVKFALENNLDIKSAAAARDAALANADASKAEHYPTLTAQIKYDDSATDLDREDKTSNASSDFNNDQWGTTASINLQVPIFTGGYISANRRQAYEQYNASLERFSGTVRNTEQATRALHLSVVTDVARVKARKQAIISSRSALEATEAGYEVGTRNIVDVLTVQQSLYNAIRDYANVRYDYVVNMLKLKRAAGTLSPQDILDLNQWLAMPPAPTASGNR